MDSNHHDRINSPAGYRYLTPQSLVSLVNKVRPTPGPCYTVGGKDGVNLYLQGFQRTRDGEHIVSAADTSQLFKPVGREKGAGTGKRARKG